MKKITSVNGLIFLFKDIPDQRRNKLGIASGESVLLSIYENDTFFFSNDVNLIKYSNILKEENPTDLEIDFFNRIKQEKEMKYKRSLVDEYKIAKYVHYLPRVTFKQKQISDEELEIIGNIRYPESIYDKDIPIISIDDKVLPLNDDSQFKHLVSPIPKKGEKVTFSLDLSKQLIARACVIK